MMGIIKKIITKVGLKITNDGVHDEQLQDGEFVKVIKGEIKVISGDFDEEVIELAKRISMFADVVTVNRYDSIDDKVNVNDRMFSLTIDTVSRKVYLNFLRWKKGEEAGRRINRILEMLDGYAYVTPKTLLFPRGGDKLFDEIWFESKGSNSYCLHVNGRKYVVEGIISRVYEVGD